jgi:hypothetical protein
LENGGLGGEEHGNAVGYRGAVRCQRQGRGLVGWSHCCACMWCCGVACSLNMREKERARRSSGSRAGSGRARFGYTTTQVSSPDQVKAPMVCTARQCRAIMPLAENTSSMEGEKSVFGGGAQREMGAARRTQKIWREIGALILSIWDISYATQCTYLTVRIAQS